MKPVPIGYVLCPSTANKRPIVLDKVPIIPTQIIPRASFRTVARSGAPIAKRLGSLVHQFGEAEGKGDVWDRLSVRGPGRVWVIVWSGARQKDGRGV